MSPLMQWLSSRFSRRPALRCVVSFDELSAILRRPDGATEAVAWSELREVDIMTTASGPWLDDVFLVLHGQDRGLVVPSESQGFPEFLRRVQELPGFNNQAVIEAMGSTDDARFPCWSRPD